MFRLRLGVIMIILALFIVGCNSFDIANISSKEEKINNIEKEKILHVLSQSNISDGGYRFANQEFEREYSVYASFYINLAKQDIDIDSVHLSDQTKNKIIGRFLNSKNLNLIDVYCALSSIEDYHVPNDIKEKISEYIRTLYVKEGGYYTLDSRGNSDVNLQILTSYYVYEVAKMLGINDELKFSEDYIKNTVEKVCVKEKVTKERISLYKELFVLSDAYKIEIDGDIKKSILSMCESSFTNVENLAADIDKFGIEYVMESLEVCNYLAGIIEDKAYKSELLRFCVLKDGAINDKLFGYDVFKLYSLTHSLKLLDYDFKNSSNEFRVLKNIDDFSIGTNEYINPGYVESNLYDTYYAYSLLKEIGEVNNKEIIKYCNKYKQSVLSTDNLLELCLYIKLLHLNGMLNLVGNELDDLKNRLSQEWDRLKADKENFTKNLVAINNVMECMDIIGLEKFRSEKSYNELVRSYKDVDDYERNIYHSIEFIRFLNKIEYQDKVFLNSLCETLEKNIHSLECRRMENKLIICSMSYDLFNEIGYKTLNSTNGCIEKILRKSKSNSGLFYGGDSDEDVASFYSTYYAVTLIKKMEVSTWKNALRL